MLERGFRTIPLIFIKGGKDLIRLIIVIVRNVQKREFYEKYTQ